MNSVKLELLEAMRAMCRARRSVKTAVAVDRLAVLEIEEVIEREIDRARAEIESAAEPEASPA